MCADGWGGGTRTKTTPVAREVTADAQNLVNPFLPTAPKKEGVKN